jgi:hypothetical protein
VIGTRRASIRRMMDKQAHADSDSPSFDLGAKFDDIKRRAIAAKDAFVPANWWKNPWVKVGLGVAVGYAIGSRRRPTANHETLLHAIVRAGLAAAAAILVRQAFEDSTRA